MKGSYKPVIRRQKLTSLLATYCLATAGKKGSFTAKNAQVIKLESTVCNAATNTVTLAAKKAFALT